MMISPMSYTTEQLGNAFKTLDTAANQLSALTKNATATTPEIFQAADKALNSADHAARIAASFLSDEKLGAAASQARQGIEHLLEKGDSIVEQLNEYFSTRAMRDLYRVAGGLHGVSVAMAQNINDAR